MAEVPAELFDYALKSQLNNIRYSNSVARDIIALLNEADKEILAKLEKWGDSGRFTPSRLRALLKEIRQMVSESYAGAHEQIRGDMAAFADHVAVDTAGMIATQLPAVGFNMVGLSKEQIAAVVSDTPIRISKDGAMLLAETFSVLVDGKNKAVMGAIRLGMVSGESMPEITRRLKGTAAAGYKDGILEGSRRQMSNLAHSVVQHTNNQAALATYRNNSEVLNGFVDIATFDSKTCLFCVSKNGQVFQLQEQGPIWHIGCRCFTVPQIKTFKEMGIDLPEFDAGMKATKSGVVSADLSFHDWLKGEDKKTQVEMLGPKRAELFRSGGLKLDKFTDASGKAYTLEVLKEKNQAAFKKAFGA